MEQNEKSSTYLIYAVLFVIILILVGITVSYAYFKVNVSESGTSSISAAADCIDISYSEENTIDLDYNYPVTDEYALANVRPVTIKVKNNCSNNIDNVNYTLAITSLANATGYISDNKIRINVKKQVGSAAESQLITSNYLSNLTNLTSGNAYNYLVSDLASRTGISSYTNKTSYTIDSNSIANGVTNIYKVYLWVDYYEGDTTHTGLNDNSTQNQKFASAISLVVNP